MNRGLDLVKKGLRNPRGVLAHVLGRLFPDAPWGPGWYRGNGFITFEDGEFAGGSPSRAELSARIFYEACQLEEAVVGREFEWSLEIGCGYGRLSGWVARLAEESVAIEPNEEALVEAASLYPDVEFHRTTAEDLPFDDGHFDLGVSWSVFSHIPPDSIGEACAEICRVLDADATLVVCEKTRGEASAASWPRTAAEYEQLFEPFELAAVGERQTEPSFSYGDRYELLVFGGR